MIQFAKGRDPVCNPRARSARGTATSDTLIVHRVQLVPRCDGETHERP